MNKRLLPVFLRVIFAVLLLILSQTLAGILVLVIHLQEFLSVLTAYSQIDAKLLELLMSRQTEMLLISYAIVIIALFIAAKVKKQSFPAYVGLHRKAPFALIVLGLLTGAAAAVWSTIAIGLVPWPAQWMETYEAESSVLQTSMPLLDVLAVVVFGPIIEELLFRGLIYDAFASVLPAGLAVLFQGVLFGSVHGTTIWMIYAALVGCLIGYVRKRTGSLWPCIAMHMAYNGSSYPISWFFDRYGEDGTTVVIAFVASALLLILFVYGINFRTQPTDPPKA